MLICFKMKLCWFPLEKCAVTNKHVFLRTVFARVDTQFASMINLVVGSLDKKSQMLLVYVDLYFYILLYFRRANYKEVLPTVCSAETHHQVYFMKRAGSLSWVLCLKI